MFGRSIDCSCHSPFERNENQNGTSEKTDHSTGPVNQINRRFSGILKRLFIKVVNKHDPSNDPLYFIATVLDPNFKSKIPMAFFDESFAGDRIKVNQSLIDLVKLD